MSADTRLLREARRRLARRGSKGTPSDHGFCSRCHQNEAYLHGQVLEVLDAIADHADAVVQG